MKRIDYIKPLPCGMWRTYHQYYVLTAVYSAIATAFLTSTHSIFVAIIYAIALISFVMGTIKKKKIAEEGCKEIILKVSEYTYIPKILFDKGKPSGMLLEPLEKTGLDKKIHVAIRSGDIPEIDSVIRLYVPANIEMACYEDTYYFPLVYDYVKESA